MTLYYQHILVLVKRLLLALALFVLGRVFFLVYNHDVFTQLPSWDFPYLFLVGLRFDTSVLVYTHLLFILMHALPLGNIKLHKVYQRFLEVYFILINAILLLINLGDSIYFNFILKRSTADVLKLIFLSNDVFNLLPSFIIDYWYVPVLWLILMVGSFTIYPSIKDRDKSKNMLRSSMGLWPVLGRFFIFLVIMGLALIGGRGGLQKKPLSIMHASKYTNPKHVPIVLNTPFAMMTTFGNNVLEEKHYFSDEEVDNIYPLIHQYPKDSIQFQNMNVVVLLLESYSRAYNGFLNEYEGYTPFLDSLMEHSLVFPNAYSNGLRSIDAIPAIVSGLPILMDDPFITSVYSTNAIESLAQIFNKQSYHTAFFHGGNNGTMDFDGFAGYAGFKEYHGRQEFGSSDHYDGFWGVFDEPFLQYMAHKLNAFEQPFFAFEFTLSSHNPYRVPDEHKGRFPEGDLRIHKVVRYTDYALRKFFETAASMPWYNNTLFIILADHPAQSTLPSKKSDESQALNKPSNERLHFYGNSTGRFAIPMLMFAPGDRHLQGIDSSIVQQTDVMPSILDYLNYSEAFFAFGRSCFDTTAQDLAVHYTNGLYQLTQDDFTLMFDGQKSLQLYHNVKDPMHKKNLLKSEPERVVRMEQQLKAILQQYYNRHINNRLRTGS